MMKFILNVVFVAISSCTLAQKPNEGLINKSLALFNQNTRFN